MRRSREGKRSEAMAARGDAMRAKRAKREDVTHRTRWYRARGEPTTTTTTTTNRFERIAASRFDLVEFRSGRRPKPSIATLWKFRRVTLPSVAAALLPCPYANRTELVDRRATLELWRIEERRTRRTKTKREREREAGKKERRSEEGERTGRSYLVPQHG